METCSFYESLRNSLRLVMQGGEGKSNGLIKLELSYDALLWYVQ